MNITIALIVTVLGLMVGCVTSTPALKETIDKIWDARGEPVKVLGLICILAGTAGLIHMMEMLELIPLLLSIPAGYGLGKGLGLASAWARLRLLKSRNKLVALKVVENEEEAKRRKAVTKTANELREKILSILLHTSPTASSAIQQHIDAIIDEKLPVLLQRRTAVRIAIEDSEPFVKKIRDGGNLPEYLIVDSVNDLKTFKQEVERIDSDIDELVDLLRKLVTDCHELRLNMREGEELEHLVRKRIERCHDDVNRIIEHENTFHDDLRAQTQEDPLTRARREVKTRKQRGG